MEYEGFSNVINFSSLPSPSDKYIIECIIAEGAFGAVYDAVDRWKASSHIAVKTVPRICKNIEVIEREYEILSQTSGHECFPEFFGIFLNKPEDDPASHEIWFAMELCSLGSVGELVRRLNKLCRYLQEHLIAYIFQSVTKGLCYLHTQRSMHRDVKCDNFLITEAGLVKICDFGQAGYLSSTLSRRCTCVGSVSWIAPEVVLCTDQGEMDYDRRCDVWSLGISVIECCDGVPPLSTLPPVRALFHIAHNPPPTLTRPMDWTEHLRDFITECLVKNPDHRPHMEEVMEHPFLSAAESASNMGPRLVEVVLEVNSSYLSSVELEPESNTSTSIPQAITSRTNVKRNKMEDPQQLIVEDLATLDLYNEQAIVKALQDRWRNGELYTWMADVLIAVNTNDVKHSYDDKAHAIYTHKARSSNAPHIFAVADKAHQDLLHHKEPQTIVLTGEAGSGKTFSCNRLVEHLCHLGGAPPGSTLYDKVQGIIPVLDALGNASTELNSNATRHVRVIELMFAPTGRLCGMHATVSLLETLRLVHVPGGESNYPILYYLYDGLSQTGRLKQYGLSVGRHYELLARHHLDNEVRNAQQLLELETHFQAIGFTDKEIHAAYQVLAGILHLGNIVFIDRHGKSAIHGQETVKEAARQLGVDDRKLAWALCNCCDISQEDPKSDIKQRTLSVRDAEGAKNALIQALYSRLVDTIIELINAKLAPKRKTTSAPCQSIRVLDMPGFEATDHNKLEQLLVNILNEQIQYYYNQVTFTWEMDDYENEGVSGTKLYSFPDNRHLLELFLAKRTGILELIEEQTKNSRMEDGQLDGRLSKKAEGRLVSRMAQDIFAIAHYVGRVKYDFSNVLDNNKDANTAELILTMRRSSTPLVAAMFNSQLTKTGHLAPNAIMSRLYKNEVPVSPSPIAGSWEDSSSKASQTRHLLTRVTSFRHSLIALLYVLTRSTPHFVRCIRGSMEDTDTFDVGMVKHQVKYHAMCDTITIRQQGFSHRLNFSDFLKRYEFLAFDFDETVDTTADNARLLLVRLKMEGWAIGSSRVFLKYYMEEYLSRLYERQLKKIIKIQAMIRSFIQLKRLKRISGVAKVDAKQEKDKEVQQIGGKKKSNAAAKDIEERVRFKEETIEAEAAHIIQHYFKKWKAKTLLQVLMTYRADKTQHLVYFCQQVHLFSQECQAKNFNINNLVPLARVVRQNPNSHNRLLASHAPVKRSKMPLDHTLAVYFDTSYLCHPSRVHRQQDDDWEGPFKSRLAAERADHMGVKCYSLTSDVPLPPVATEYTLMANDQQTINEQRPKERILVSNEIGGDDGNMDVSESSEMFDQEGSKNDLQVEEENLNEVDVMVNNNKSLAQSVFDVIPQNKSAPNNEPEQQFLKEGPVREMVYKSKRPESREQANEDIDRDCGRVTNRNSYNRFAAVTPASRPATSGFTYSNYNFSYIGLPATSAPKTPPNSAPQMCGYKGTALGPATGASAPKGTPQAAMLELKLKAQKQRRCGENELKAAQGKLRKTNYARDSMKRAHEIATYNKTDHSNYKTDHSNYKTDHSNYKTDHSNYKTDHSNYKTDHSNYKNNHSNYKTDHSNHKTDNSNNVNTRNTNYQNVKQSNTNNQNNSRSNFSYNSLRVENNNDQQNNNSDLGSYDYKSKSENNVSNINKPNNVSNINKPNNVSNINKPNNVSKAPAPKPPTPVAELGRSKEGLLEDDGSNSMMDLNEEIRRVSSDLMDMADNQGLLPEEFCDAFTANSDEASL